MQPKVSIVILNWNQPDITIRCVKSVLEQSFQDFDIVLVDNGSKDDSLTRLKAEFGDNPRISLVENPKNLGFSGGANVGAEHAIGRYMAFLNNDTVVEKDWLLYLVETIEKDSNLGAVSSIELVEGQERPTEYFRQQTASLFGYHAKYQADSQGDVIDSFSIRGAAFIYDPKKAFPPFDSEYFIYAEDIRLGWVLNLKGYYNKTSLKSVVFHHFNATKKKNKSIRPYFTFLGERNRLINHFTLYSAKNIVKLMPLLFVNVVLLNAAEPKKIVSRFKSYWWLLTHMGSVQKKRKVLQQQRAVSDDAITKKMSSALCDDVMVSGKPAKSVLRGVNKFFTLYCKLLRIPTKETA